MQRGHVASPLEITKLRYGRFGHRSWRFGGRWADRAHPCGGDETCVRMSATGRNAHEYEHQNRAGRRCWSRTRGHSGAGVACSGQIESLQYHRGRSARSSALSVYTPLILAAIKAAGGRTFNTAGGKTVAFTGEAPQRVGIIEWDNLERAQLFFHSPAFSSLAPQRDKAERYIRQYAVEATSN